jgi:GT2 family glycosyltransferase
MTAITPDEEAPEVSVVLVTHGAWQLARRAIDALRAHTSRAFELLLVDNASDPETRVHLSRVSGARLTRNDQNQGFGPASNQGAAQARGEYLVFLNSDAFVHAGWVEPLLETIERPGVGAVVPRYLAPDGGLQEAGALLGRDGTVRLYGEGDDPQRACYRFRRIIDYGSAVCMLLKRQTFAACGGFDSRFAPAYYEDVDLCLRLAQRGLSVVYDPRSTVTHVRHGSGEVAAASALSERNRVRFIERWETALQGRPPSFLDASFQRVILARDALATPRLLICARTDDPRVQMIAGGFIARWPRARVTWACGAGGVPDFDADAWRVFGVEVLGPDEPSWLGERLFHYDAVLCDEGTSQPLATLARETQPQAVWLELDQIDSTTDDPLARIVPVLAGAGIAPSSTWFSSLPSPGCR